MHYVIVSDLRKTHTHTASKKDDFRSRRGLFRVLMCSEHITSMHHFKSCCVEFRTVKLSR